MNDIYHKRPNANVCKLKHSPTKKQVADLFTKSLKVGTEWWPAIRKLGFSLSLQDFDATYETSVEAKVDSKTKETRC